MVLINPTFDQIAKLVSSCSALRVVCVGPDIAIGDAYYYLHEELANALNRKDRPDVLRLDFLIEVSRGEYAANLTYSHIEGKCDFRWQAHIRPEHDLILSDIISCFNHQLAEELR